MTKFKFPVTRAVRVLHRHKAEFSHHLYDYQTGGGAVQGIQSLGMVPSVVIKTLTMEDNGDFLSEMTLLALHHYSRRFRLRRYGRSFL